MRSQRKLGSRTKGILGFAVLTASFAIGLWLGQVTQPADPGHPAPRQDVARLFAEPRTPKAKAAPAEKDLIEPQKSLRLRVRSTAQLSSREARSGDAVLFVTEQPVQTHSGHHVPAGALVEAVVARAKPSSGQQPGSLVIEIRALHVGARTIPLHALPYIPKAVASADAQLAETPTKLVDPRALRIRNQLRVNPEVVMPKETVIEFELVESAPGLVLPRPSPSPRTPIPAIGVPAPAKGTLPLQTVPDSPRPTRSIHPRIAVDAV
jgi:hypothetical protein